MTIHTNGELQAQHLTGRVRGRVGWFGRVVMQVEIRSPKPMYPHAQMSEPDFQADVWSRGAYTFWRDATHDDLAAGACAPQQQGAGA